MRVLKCRSLHTQTHAREHTAHYRPFNRCGTGIGQLCVRVCMCGACQEINSLVVCIVKVENLRLCRKIMKMVLKFCLMSFIYTYVCSLCFDFHLYFEISAFVCLNSHLLCLIYNNFCVYAKEPGVELHLFWLFFWFSAHLNTVVFYLYTYI